MADGVRAVVHEASTVRFNLLRKMRLGAIVDGLEFERMVQETLGVTDIGVVVRNGQRLATRGRPAGSAVLDGMFHGYVIEIKRAHFNPAQVRQLALYAEQESTHLIFFFKHKPSSAEIQAMEQVLRDTTGDRVGLAINYAFPW
jgi:hypothetical protein